MRSSTFIAAFASIASLTSSLVTAGQSSGSGSDTPLRILARDKTDNIVKRDLNNSGGNLAAAPARSRHATRDHRAYARNARANAKPKSSTLKKRQSSSGRKCKVHNSANDGVTYLPESNDDDSSSSSSSTSGGSSSSSSSGSSSRNTSGTIEDEKTTSDSGSSSSSGGVGDLDLDTSSNFLKIGNIYAGFLPGECSFGAILDAGSLVLL